MRFLWFLCLCCLLWAHGISSAQVILDGILGEGTRLQLEGQNYVISADMGEKHGTNLFHSFEQFDIWQGESATFTGPRSIENILARITGEVPSYIDGTISSLIRGANLFFLNPYGIMFGPHAQLDVQGSFHVSTADYVRFSDGKRFNTGGNDQTGLTVAAPVAFGFLDWRAGAITIDRSQLSIPANRTLSVVGGDIHIDGPSLVAPSGQVHLVSVASPTEVSWEASGLTSPFDFDRDSRLGEIVIKSEASINASEGRGRNARGNGMVIIRARTLNVLEGATINADRSGSRGTGAETAIEIDVQENVLLEASTISANSERGIGGAIRIVAGRLELRDNSIVTAEIVRGRPKDISIEVQHLTLSGGSQISTSTAGVESGGNIIYNVPRNLDSELG